MVVVVVVVVVQLSAALRFAIYTTVNICFITGSLTVGIGASLVVEYSPEYSL